MISHRRKRIHIPKTAGTSIEQKLEHFDAAKDGVQDHRRLRDVEPISLCVRSDLSLPLARLTRKVSAGASPMAGSPC